MTTTANTTKSEGKPQFDTTGKTRLTRAEFEKKVEIEYCWLVRWEYMNPDEAMPKARKTIGSEFFY